MLYNRPEHNQDFSICFIIKNPLNSPRITFNFQNKLYFQSELQCSQHALYSHKRQPNSQEHEDCSGWQRRKTRLLWLMWPSTQRIGKVIRASSYFSTRRVVDLVPEACSTAMTEDRHDELAAIDLSMIAVALTPSWLVWILTVMPVWLYFSSFLFCSVLFLNTELYILYEC